MSKGFDEVAHEYDAAFTHTALGCLLRERVRACTGGFSRRSARGNPAAKAAGTAFELNCGTGEDAIWLARQGWQVLATDASPEMIALANLKIEHAGLAEKAIARVCSFAEIEHLPEGNFDLIFSNFGGFNCVPPVELEALGKVLFQKLKPGGKFVAVVMGRFCWWETLYFLLKMKPRKAFRRFSKKPLEARLGAQATVSTWYYTPTEFQKLLQPNGQELGVNGQNSRVNGQWSKANGQKSKVIPIGLWLPPSYLNPFFEKHPRLLRFLNFLEKKFAPSWLAFAADHFWVCIERPIKI